MGRKEDNNSEVVKKAPADPKSKLSISTSGIIQIKTASSFYLFIFYQNYQRLYLPLQILPEKKEKDRENMTRAIFYKTPQNRRVREGSTGEPI